MTMNKQTVWLVTMLTLMVVLSGYYMVTSPVTPANQLASKTDALLKGINVNIKPVEQPLPNQTSADDYLLAYQIQRNTLRGQLTEQYMNVLTNPDASAQAIKEANDKINGLTKVDNQESVLEDLIIKDGYKDAVVIKGDQHVDVIVEADKLTNTQAVQLINMARDHLNVSSNIVSVGYRP